MTNRALSVSQLNLYVKSVLESDGNLRSVFVRGEISNYTRNARSGHAYFSLKDAGASVRVVMFSSAVEKLKFSPADGMSVVVSGKVGLYERDGQYQLSAFSMEPEGVGAVYMVFRQLCRKLSSEGLFDERFKKPIPIFPRKIGVITSSTGAAIRDIISVSRRRFSGIPLYIRPISVQGDSCAEDARRAIEFFNCNFPVDVILLARGGGSYEDLAGFNDEKLARAIFASEIPIISAIGHEIDFTVADYVADLRAPTPSAAAELAVPLRTDLEAQILQTKNACRVAFLARLDAEEQNLKTLHYRLNFSAFLEKRKGEIGVLAYRTKVAFLHALHKKEADLRTVTGKIQALSPLATLMRGYAIVYKDGKRIFRVSDVHRGDALKIRMKDGEIDCVAEKNTTL